MKNNYQIHNKMKRMKKLKRKDGEVHLVSSQEMQRMLNNKK